MRPAPRCLGWKQDREDDAFGFDLADAVAADCVTAADFRVWSDPMMREALRLCDRGEGLFFGVAIDGAIEGIALKVR